MAECIVQLQKISILPHRRDWNFQRGGVVLKRNPFHGGGKDIFWNYTFRIEGAYKCAPVALTFSGHL